MEDDSVDITLFEKSRSPFMNIKCCFEKIKRIRYDVDNRSFFNMMSSYYNKTTSVV